MTEYRLTRVKSPVYFSKVRLQYHRNETITNSDTDPQCVKANLESRTIFSSMILLKIAAF